MSLAVEFTNKATAREDNEEDRNERTDALRVSDQMALPSDQAFLQAAISLKNQVVEATWRSFSGRGSVDPTVYSGLTGTAFACLRAYEATGNKDDLLMCAEIVDTCAAVARASKRRHVTFLCGTSGVYAVGAVVAARIGDQTKRDMFLDLFHQVAQERALPIGPEDGGFGMSYELLHGRAGFLWAALFINKHLGEDTVSKDVLMPIVEAVLAGGRAGASDNTACPLVYRWHGTSYWGAAHGLAGILHTLLHFQLTEEGVEDVKGTLRYMMRNRFPHSGNYPLSEGNPKDKLVQWSHGAPGMAITLCKATQVYSNDRDFRDGAIEAGEVVWKNGLVRKVGLADGVCGNAYTFLSLYRLTGESLYIERAKAFAGFLHQYDPAKLVTAGHLRGCDNAYSLFHGLAGTACLWFDVVSPERSRFPGFEL
ncbi:hypothetical protein Scep_018510 [Stephania cephalantha]|uniref:LanC-like protein GCL1 n=1 Tax=Stephania cephalantha TaxID=152367 RepID=A0AAP0I930_9MAGN